MIWEDFFASKYSFSLCSFNFFSKKLEAACLSWERIEQRRINFVELENTIHRKKFFFLRLSSNLFFENFKIVDKRIVLSSSSVHATFVRRYKDRLQIAGLILSVSFWLHPPVRVTIAPKEPFSRIAPY